jgi:hypothetical protein
LARRLPVLQTYSENHQPPGYMAKKKGIGRYLALDYLTEGLILKNLMFVLFLGALAVVYIANSHYAERNARKVLALQKEIKELRWQYLTIESENMYNSRRTELTERLRKEDFLPAPTTPRRIIVSKKDYADGH